MVKEISYNEYAAKALDVLSKGAFLTTCYGGKTNTMAIAWGCIGHMWAKPVFMAMVRGSRYTFELLEKSGEFTVSLPFEDMQEAIGITGSQSGRDTDKIAAAGLTAQPGKKAATPIIAGRGLHYECKVVFKQAMNPEKLDPEFNQKWYDKGDYHTLYFGEILATYIDE